MVWLTFAPLQQLCHTQQSAHTKPAIHGHNIIVIYLISFEMDNLLNTIRSRCRTLYKGASP